MEIGNFIRKDYKEVTPFVGIASIKELLGKHTAVIIKDKDGFHGVLTHYDIVKRSCILAIDCVIKKPEITKDTTICDTLALMRVSNTDVLPFFKDEKFEGVIFKHDLVNHLSEYNQSLIEQIEQHKIELAELNAEIENKSIGLEKIIETKDKFLSIIAHELKNPIGSITGLSSFIKDNLEQYDSEKVKSFLDIITAASENTMQILEDLFSWAKSQSGDIIFNPTPIALNEFILNELQSIEELALKKSIVLTLESKLELNILADEKMLKTIIRNLVTNAIKFSNKNKTITIKTVEENEFVNIAICDNGVGMTDEQKSKLFQISKHRSTEGTEGERGTGLGLMLCKEFVEKHGGKIWIKSKVGNGTEMWFSILR